MNKFTSALNFHSITTNSFTIFGGQACLEKKP